MDALMGITLRDRAALIEDVLVIADLHVGYNATSNVEFPVGEGSDMIERFDALCAAFDPREVVIAGDLLHSFRTLPGPVKGTLEGLQSVAAEYDASIVVTPGNHDTLLDAIWTGETVEEYRIGETIITHGHVKPEADADRYIVGHDHPTMSIEGTRQPCYLVGDGVYDGSDVCMLPAFTRLVRGVEINGMSTADFMSPLIADADSFAPVVWDSEGDQTLEFPLLGEFRHRL